MSQTASTLLLRNLHDVFGEIDSVRRRAAIDEIFQEDAVFYVLNWVRGQRVILSFDPQRPNYELR